MEKKRGRNQKGSEPAGAKRRMVLAGVKSGKSLMQAAIDAGYAPSTAKRGLTAIAGKNPEIAEGVREQFRHMFTLDDLHRHLVAGCDAMDTRFVPSERTRVIKKTQDGTVVEKEVTGAPRRVRVASWHARHRYLELATKIAGYFEEQPLVSVDARAATTEAAGSAEVTVMDVSEQRKRRLVNLYSELALKKAEAFDIPMPRDLKAQADLIDLDKEEGTDEWSDSKLQ